MAIKLISNYSKKAGLPNFSSHQFSVCVETELTDLGQVQGEVTRLYSLLQDAVDREMQHVGFVPDEVYGMGPAQDESIQRNDNDCCQSQGKDPRHDARGGASRRDPAWKCSDKQKELILKLVLEHDLDRNVIEELAIERFGHGVRELNKLQASGLIDEILETYASNGNSNGNGNGNHRRNGNGGYGRSRSTAGKGGRS